MWRTRQTFRSEVVVFVIAYFLLISVSQHAIAENRYFAIIIDDMGNNLDLGSRAIALPGLVTYSFLPFTSHVDLLVNLATDNNKEIMLHLPMQPIGEKNMGSGGLHLDMDRELFLQTVRRDIRAIPMAIGINNHMGSLITQHPIKMMWLMQELKYNQSLYFVDSRTHFASVAAQQAIAQNLANASRDIFLDHVIDKAQIDIQFNRLLKLINLSGHALAIGHPHKLTLAALEYWLPIFRGKGIELVSVSHYIELENNRRKLWQASLSHLRKVVKN